MVKQKLLKIVECFGIFFAMNILIIVFIPKRDVSAENNSIILRPTFTADNFSSVNLTIGDNNINSNKKFDKKDINKAIQYMKMNENRNLEPLQLQLSPTFTPPDLNNQNYVQPILFIASDLSESQDNIQGINSTFQMLKRWFSGALEYNNSGYIYRVADTIVYHASQPISYYKCINHETSCDNYDGIWGNIQTELVSAGYPLWSYGTSFVIFVKGSGGWAGSNCVPNCGTNYPAPGPASYGGFAILGDWALDAISGTVNNDCFVSMASACYREPQEGAVGHELGHTFGLAHALDQEGSIMYSWWNFPYISLFDNQGNDEKGLLRNNSIFFLAQECTKDVLINQVNIPAQVKTKSQFIASFNVTNYGFCHWSARDVDLHVVRDDVWKIKLQQLNQDVYPAQSYIFSISLTAPMIRVSSKVYNNIWQMRALNRYFGDQMGRPVTVIR